MLPFLQISDTPDADIVPVDCPTCPISMSCLTSRSGTGWRFDCCGTAVMALGDGAVMVDCQINQFRDDRRSGRFDSCLLCSGSIMEAVELARLDVASVTTYYLPTVHAKILLADRLVAFRARHRKVKVGRALARSIENEEG